MAGFAQRSQELRGLSGPHTFPTRSNSESSSVPNRLNIFGQRGKDSGGYNQEVLQLLDDQRRIADENRAAGLADRDAALSILNERIGQRSPAWQSAYESLSGDPGDTPFGNMLRSSIEATLQNPDVYTQDQVEGFVSRTNEGAARAVNDALLATRTSNAQRGVSGGVTQGNEQQLHIQAAADAAAARGQIEFAAAEARAANKQFAQQLGVQFESATQQARNARLNMLAGFVSEAEVRDLELVTGTAEILANTVRENPDYSGFASILSDVNRQAQDMLIQRENLALLREQIRVQEELGIADINLRANYGQAQLDYQRVLSDLEDQLADFERQLREVE